MHTGFQEMVKTKCRGSFSAVASKGSISCLSTPATWLNLKAGLYWGGRLLWSTSRVTHPTTTAMLPPAPQPEQPPAQSSQRESKLWAWLAAKELGLRQGAQRLKAAQRYWPNPLLQCCMYVFMHACMHACMYVCTTVCTMMYMTLVNSTDTYSTAPP